MKRILAGCVSLCLMAGGPASAQLDAKDIRNYADDAYTGRLELSVFSPEGKKLFNQSGHADMQLGLSPANMLDLTLKGNLTEDGHMTITARLEPDGAGGWVDTGDQLKIFISPEGAISGRGVKDSTEIIYSGQVTDVRFELSMVATFIKEDESGAPVGTHMLHEFSLQRKQLAKARREAAPAGGECERIVMQPRTVANVYGGAMDMIMVPVCMPAQKK